MTTKELFDILCDELLPIITKDEDIIRVIQKSNISDEDANLIVLWLLNATIGCMLNGSTGEVEKKLMENCAHDMSVAVHKLQESGFGEDINESLGKILEENIGEWLQIVSAKFKKAKKGMKDDHDENVGGEEAESESPAVAVFKLYTSFLGSVVVREDDVLEFLDKYSNIDKDALTFYVVANVYYSYLKEIEKGKINPPKNSQVVKYHSELLQITSSYLEHIGKEYLVGNIEDADQFNNDMGEIINDHFNEFVKKMFKKIFAAADKANK